MPLRSQLFSGNPKLQACLVSHAAHVTPGARGEHVELIQAALIRFRFLEPEAALAEAGFYGKETAAAVLAYKRTFNIINRSYQTTADNVVGIMTIASLDHHMTILESVRHVPAYVPPVFPTYRLFTTDKAPSKTGEAKLAITGPRLPPATGGTGKFDPPLSGFPQDMQDTIERSNLAKVPGTPSMYPWVSNHEGPLSNSDLSKRFADPRFNSDKALMFELYERMKPFGIWGLIRTIRGMYFGVGARGMFCHPFDHAKSFSHMQTLSTGPTDKPNPVLNDITKALPVTHSRFCKDAFNVHGERDSWREIVTGGPGLHICVTNASGRARTDENYPASDFHIDEIQQGQFCSNGVCIPLVNGQTIGHLKTVGPWLLKQPGEFLKKHSPF